MQTSVLSLHDVSAQTQAFVLLAAHEIIAAPTDTVYGLMARFDSAVAIAKLYEAKDRPAERAIPVLIGQIDQLEQLTPAPIGLVAQRLIERMWPGPLTIVLPALPGLLAILTAGQPTVAVRMPDYAPLQSLIQRAGPLAATSANRSGGADTATSAAVLAQLAGRIPLLLTDDRLDLAADSSPQPSTIIDLSALASGGPRLLRNGPIAASVRQILADEFGYSC